MDQEKEGKDSSENKEIQKLIKKFLNGQSLINQERDGTMKREEITRRDLTDNRLYPRMIDR